MVLQLRVSGNRDSKPSFNELVEKGAESLASLKKAEFSTKVELSRESEDIFDLRFHGYPDKACFSPEWSVFNHRDADLRLGLDRERGYFIFLQNPHGIHIASEYLKLPEDVDLGCVMEILRSDDLVAISQIGSLNVKRLVSKKGSLVISPLPYFELREIVELLGKTYASTSVHLTQLRAPRKRKSRYPRDFIEDFIDKERARESSFKWVSRRNRRKKNRVAFGIALPNAVYRTRGSGSLPRYCDHTYAANVLGVFPSVALRSMRRQGVPCKDNLFVKENVDMWLEAIKNESEDGENYLSFGMVGYALNGEKLSGLFDGYCRPLTKRGTKKLIFFDAVKRNFEKDKAEEILLRAGFVKRYESEKDKKPADYKESGRIFDPSKTYKIKEIPSLGKGIDKEYVDVIRNLRHSNVIEGMQLVEVFIGLRDTEALHSLGYQGHIPDIKKQLERERHR